MPFPDPPHLSLTTWWLVAYAATAVCLAVCVPIMPTPHAKKCMTLVPAAAVFIALAMRMRTHLDMAGMLCVYSSTVLIAPLGMAGRRKDVHKMASDARLFGAKNELAPMRLHVQMCTALVAMMAVWTWFIWAGRA